MDGIPTNLLMSLGTIAAALFFFGFVVLVMLAKFYRKVDQGRALIVNPLRGQPEVTFTGSMVLPVIHRAEIMDISVKAIEIDRRGKEGLICRDNIRADIKVAFFVRVNKTSEDVLKVAQAIGCERASNQATLEQLFVAKFSEALKTVGKRLDFEELYTKRDDFKDQIIQVIGKDLNGYALEDAAIDFLEQTDLDSLDPKNILDARGIRKITQITAGQAVETNDLKQEEMKAITKQNVEAREAVLALERQQADAEARQQREVATVKAREAAETAKVQAEETRRAQLARIQAEEDLGVADENKQRQVEVAQKNRERVVAIENERVVKDRDLEAISRERETELLRIEKEKALEIEKKAIADNIAARISVEKSVAAEEERIKDLRVVADAKRKKEAIVIAAEAQAEEKLLKTVKEAEAQEQVAAFKAKEEVILADARLEAADREARSKIRVAEGTQAEEAAAGLAAAKVKEADATATEKMGLAQARVQLEAMQAEAKGQLATADAVERMGAAEASATQQRMEAEARGLTEKAQAMKALDEESREHEEFRLRLEKAETIERETLAMRQAIAKEQAVVLGEALGNAKINLVGGDGAFLQQFFKAVSVGHSVDGALDNSEVLRSTAREYIDGEANLREDLKDILTRPAVSSETVKNLSISAALREFANGVDEGKREKINALLSQAKQLGLE